MNKIDKYLIKIISQVLFLILILFNHEAFAQRPSACEFKNSTGVNRIITMLSLNNQINYTSNDISKSYIDSPQEATLMAGGAYQVSFTGGVYRDSVTNDWRIDGYSLNILIDFNKDGDFDDVGEYWYFTGRKGYWFVYNFQDSCVITIPENVPPGLYRMRVITAPHIYTAFETGCGEGGSGTSAVDFGINVTPPDSSFYPRIEGFDNNVYCSATSMKIYYHTNGYYGIKNQFHAQISDSTGDFSFPIYLRGGTTNRKGLSDSIVCEIPQYISGNHFRVRMVSTDPAAAGPDNGLDFRINPQPEIDDNIWFYLPCEGDTVTLKVNLKSDESVTWTVQPEYGLIIGSRNDSDVTIYWIQGGWTELNVIKSSSSGCLNDITMPKYINPLPKTIVYPTDKWKSCEFSTRTFTGVEWTTDTLPNEIANKWSVSGGQIIGDSTAKDVTIAWGSAGTGIIELTQTNTTTGCSYTFINPVEIWGINFKNILPATICQGGEFVLEY
ncbi:MAG: large repetitive protein, partial [Bacteroidota bacterium]|nr:large repetitive protein [Bacteroidota bacterium]